MRPSFVLLIAVAGCGAASAQAPATQARALVDEYCVSCHNRSLKTAGVVLEALDPGLAGESPATWEKVLRKVGRGEMPPAGLPRPDASATAAVTNFLTVSLDQAALAHPNPGRTALHRLNRAEYSNAIRDLLALDIKPGSMLPVDDSGYGFDNIADVLSVSPALLERYISTANLIASRAVGDLKMKPLEEEFLPPKDPPSDFRKGTRNERMSYDLPFDSRGGLSFPYYFPLDAEYAIRVKMPAINATNGETLHGFGEIQEVRLPVKAGLRTVGVTFLRESLKAEAEGPAARRAAGAAAPPPPPVTASLDVRLDGVRLKVFEAPQKATGNTDLSEVTVGGPYNVTGRGDTPSRQRIFVCRPANEAEEEPCARTILSSLARRAFRRPVNDADIRPLLSFYRSGHKGGDFDQGIEWALGAMLTSPEFLFRAEQDPPGAAPGTVYRISDNELASRLSFFLWSSIPDDELLKLAEQGKLKDPAVLDGQVRRMLSDRRSRALVNNFGGQWLYLRNLAVAKPDPQAFPDFDESLRRSLQQETEMFFESILREDRSVFDLLDADYTFLNQRLAEHYGVPGIYGSQFRRVTVTDPNRRGLLGQAGILTVTSYPNRTSVVQRGKWILENLLGAPPPPPPPDVPDLKPQGKDGKLLTMREQMEQHRGNPICAACHARMDPIGFALENYDAIGKWRTTDSGSPINAIGKLPDGTQFDGPAGLRQLLLSKYRDEFVATVAQKLLTYGLGRGLEYYDMPTVRAIARRAATENYRMSALITAVAESTPFQMRRTPQP